MTDREIKSRILFEKDVIKAVDRHMNDDGTLDDDISCILEELNDALSFNEPIIDGIYNQESISITVPRVFIFKTHEKNFIQIQKYLKECIKKGCLVIPNNVEFVGVEDIYKERNIGY